MTKKNKTCPKIFIYLSVTFIITYLFWGLDIVLCRFGLYEHPGYNVGIIFYIIAACAPAIAVFILWQRDSDKRGIKYILKTIFQFNRPITELSILLIFLMIRFGIPLCFGDVKFSGKW